MILPNINLAKEHLLLIPSFLISWWDEAQTATVSDCTRLHFSPGRDCGDSNLLQSWRRNILCTEKRCLIILLFLSPPSSWQDATLLQNTQYWQGQGTQKAGSLLGPNNVFGLLPGSVLGDQYRSYSAANTKLNCVINLFSSWVHQNSLLPTLRVGSIKNSSLAVVEQMFWNSVPELPLSSKVIALT